MGVLKMKNTKQNKYILCDGFWNLEESHWYMILETAVCREARSSTGKSARHLVMSMVVKLIELINTKRQHRLYLPRPCWDRWLSSAGSRPRILPLSSAHKDPGLCSTCSTARGRNPGSRWDVGRRSLLAPAELGSHVFGIVCLTREQKCTSIIEAK